MTRVSILREKSKSALWVAKRQISPFLFRIYAESCSSWRGLSFCSGTPIASMINATALVDPGAIEIIKYVTLN